MASDKKSKNVATIHITRDSKNESKDGSGESLVYRVLDKAEKIARTVATISKVLFGKPDKKKKTEKQKKREKKLKKFFKFDKKTGFWIFKKEKKAKKLKKEKPLKRI